MAKSGRGKSSRKTTGAKTVGRSARTGRFVSKSGSAKAVSGKSAARSAASSVVDRAKARSSSTTPHLRLVAESERLERLIAELGNNRVAGLLAVSPSQPSRWRSGKEGIGPENQRKLIDLDYVFGRLEQLFTSRQAEIWLTSYNAHLGARPIDVLRLRGAGPVIEAIDAEAQGAFA